MADFKGGMKILLGMEFSNASDALHQNPTENGLTYMGIYQSAHHELELWDKVNQLLEENDGDVEKVSQILYNDDEVTAYVYDFYKRKFWDSMRLDEIANDHTAYEMFIFGVNTHPITAAKVAQRIVGVVADGAIGSKSLAALNSFDPKVFDVVFDEKEEARYDKIIENNPEDKIYARGWKRRAHLV